MTDLAGVKFVADRPRRQNRSCDQCRSSKRRCLVTSPASENAPAICANCARLGHDCTFKFAQAQSNRSSRRSKTQKPGAADTDWFLGASLDGDTVVPTTMMELGNDLPGTWPEVSPPNGLDFFLSEFCLTPGPLDIGLPQTPKPNQASQLEGQNNLDQHPFTGGRIQNDINTPLCDAFNKPLHLLNSSLTGKIIEENLAQIYNVIVSGNALRWLPSIVPGKQKHVACENDSWLITAPDAPPLSNFVEGLIDPQSLPKPPSAGHLLQQSSTVPHMKTFEDGMTLLGAVRFLDHFGGLYGNHLGRFARKASDSALKEVLKAYSMQWLPARDGTLTGTTSSHTHLADARISTTSSISSLYHETWVHARDSLNSARNVRSFRVFYAILIFEAATAPEESHDWYFQISSFLDDAFDILRALGPLVRRHIKALGPSSLYSSALEKSLKFMEHFGYLRDTVSSLVGDRRCKLPDDFISQMPSTALGEAGCSTAADVVRKFNRQHLYELLSTLRQFLRVKTALVDVGQTVCGHPEERSQMLLQGLEAMENMEKIMNPLIGISVENFNALQAESKVQLLTLSALRSLGLSRLAKIPATTSEGGADVTSIEIEWSSKLYSYQQDAASDLSQLMRQVQAQPSLEMFNLYHGLSADIPLTGYHITTELMVISLQQAIEQLINLHETSAHKSWRPEGFSLNLTEEDRWGDCIDYLMKGLLLLDVTVGGSWSVQCASQKLITSYGDILSDCWSTDFET
ncbi:uncharacterized protein PV06_02072 [Exophiala oligosperma]|uniref:Zn(2)-C6 fungal-type domain-containing protein n=1 Tax=Exophiala oligosperma TaxID=215243 RepID=A0A0D2DV09_9EURO|nr:uncharacterized protein PV06_02072 [Exophiala oligosperma]KIW46400.1 hypothetical protein PV06_02072 [Exophiala oligosperma]